MFVLFCLVGQEIFTKNVLFAAGVEQSVRVAGMKKTVSSLVLLFLVPLLCLSLLFVGSVSANFLPASVPEHSIEITEDGAVNGTDLIQRSGNVYTFTGDIEGSIVVFCNGVVIDGAGYTLQGNGSLTGIWLQEKSGVEIRNLHIRNFWSGVMLTYGWSLDSGTDITLSGNTITDNEYGIRFSMYAHDNYILGNTIANNTYGIHATHAQNNTFRNNHLSNNVCNLWISCETCVPMSHFINDIDASNTINGKPVIYWVDEQDKTVPSDAGYVALVNCRNITVQDQTLTGNSQGILLVATSNSTITRNRIADNDYGIVLFAPYEQCVDNIITENNITASGKDGINSWNSEGTIVTGNIIAGSQEVGINFFDSRDCVISGNTLSGNTENTIKIWGNDSRNNTVSDNNYDSQSNPDDQNGAIPEFPSWIILPLLLAATVFILVCKQKLPKTSNRILGS